MVDVKQAATLTHAAGAMVVVDNTFLSPALLRPKVAEFLAGHPAIIETRYPGLQATRVTAQLNRSWIRSAGWLDL